jgi:hypothetical protein
MGCGEGQASRLTHGAPEAFASVACLVVDEVLPWAAVRP